MGNTIATLADGVVDRAVGPQGISVLLAPSSPQQREPTPGERTAERCGQRAALASPGLSPGASPHGSSPGNPGPATPRRDPPLNLVARRPAAPRRYVRHEEDRPRVRRGLARRRRLHLSFRARLQRPHLLRSFSSNSLPSTPPASSSSSSTTGPVIGSMTRGRSGSLRTPTSWNCTGCRATRPSSTRRKGSGRSRASWLPTSLLPNNGRARLGPAGNLLSLSALPWSHL